MVCELATTCCKRKPALATVISTGQQQYCIVNFINYTSNPVFIVLWNPGRLILPLRRRFFWCRSGFSEAVPWDRWKLVLENCPYWGDLIWLVVWNIFYFPIYWVANHPNWLIFFRGVQTTNQESYLIIEHGYPLVIENMACLHTVDLHIDDFPDLCSW